ncbi:MAG: DUF1929 domain-containing protein, partial [Geodermatophilaceae bacterium]|nr:DUF1929 domain-containing protein [Geodermatophilaceae bacterium]
MRGRLRAAHRRRKLITLILLPAALIAVNVPPAITFVQNYQHQRLISSPEYQSQFGKWDVINLPTDTQVNAIHAALLPSGKLLVIAGSGNNQQNFDAGSFRTLLYDPVNGQTRLILTPADMFCAGHAFLPDGKLLVAGGTKRYEVLESDVKRAAGTMIVKNVFPDGGRAFTKGTEFVSPDGRKYRATSDFAMPPATKVIKNRKATVTASQTAVFVESEDTGQAGVTEQPAQYSISGLSGADANNLYGLSEKMTLEKQDFQGIADSYEFDPITEEYTKVGDMKEKRWYPTLTGLHDGRVLAISGLDGSGQVLPGQNEIYDPATKSWKARPDLFRYFPTYPALFQTATPGTLFYSGSNAGYGPEDAGRVPGFWKLADNSFVPVPGIRDADQLETSGSSWAGPVQNQKIIVVGGGGVGESPLSTTRIDVIDIKAPAPRFINGPDLPVPDRYPNVVQLPDDNLLITGGSRDYRGKGASDNLMAKIYHPASNTLTPAADPTVGRSYHAVGILLPNGQVLTMGGDRLFGDRDNTKPAQFEKRLEIYTPPYLYHGPRPVISDAPSEAKLGSMMKVSSPDAATIGAARLIRPSAATHATDVEQRSVALDITHNPDGTLNLAVPKEPTLVPPGYYML